MFKKKIPKQHQSPRQSTRHRSKVREQEEWNIQEFVTPTGISPERISNTRRAMLHSLCEMGEGCQQKGQRLQETQHHLLFAQDWRARLLEDEGEEAAEAQRRMKPAQRWSIGNGVNPYENPYNLFRFLSVFPGNSLLGITSILLCLSDFLETYKQTSCFSPGHQLVRRSQESSSLPDEELGLALLHSIIRCMVRKRCLGPYELP